MRGGDDRFGANVLIVVHVQEKPKVYTQDKELITTALRSYLSFSVTTKFALPGDKNTLPIKMLPGRL